MENVFKALAHPIRRALLDLLYAHDGRTLGELDAQLPLTRFGTMKHLRILERADLVVTRRAGRAKLHYLNPVPMRLIHDRWIRKYTEPLVSLRGEPGRGLEQGAVERPRHLDEVHVRATPEGVWNAITRPEIAREWLAGTRLASDWKPGATLRCVAPDGRLAAEGTVLEVDPARRLAHTFSATWKEEVAADAPHRVVWTIASLGPTCRVTVEHFDFVGETATYRDVRGGLGRILDGLKTLLETGEPLAIER